MASTVASMAVASGGSEYSGEHSRREHNRREHSRARTGEREQEAVLRVVAGVAHDRADLEALREELGACPRADEAVRARDGDSRALGEGRHLNTPWRGMRSRAGPESREVLILPLMTEFALLAERRQRISLFVLFSLCNPKLSRLIGLRPELTFERFCGVRHWARECRSA
eukprot:scaffold92424_cov60-Phaeocystis_antarctica.AAC.3